MLLVLAIVAAVALMLVVNWVEPRLTFFPSPGEDDTPASRGLPHQVLDVRTADDERLTAWWLTHPAARADIIYFHGNGGNLSLWLDVGEALQRRGLNVLLFDYRGYGRSTGAPTEAGLRRDTNAVLEAYAGHLSAPHRPVIYWGRSIGSAFAAYAAERQPPAGLVLESAFANKRAVLRGAPLLRALDVLSWTDLSTVRWLRHWRGPTLVLHGDRDSVIPFALGQEVFAAIEGDKQFVRLAGHGHNDFFGPEAEAYWREVDGFVGRVADTR